MNGSDPSVITTLINAVSMLPAEMIRQVADYAEFLNRKHLSSGGLPANYSDEWTEEDLRELSAVGNQRLDEIPPAEVASEEIRKEYGLG